jgi:hypothetical protein
MTRSGKNVSALPLPGEGRQGLQLLIAGRNGTHSGWPRQRTPCYLGKLNSSAQADWLKTIEVFNEQGEAQQLKLFPSQIEPPPNDPQVARVLNKVRLERTRRFGSCWLGLQLWKRLELDRFFEEAVDDQEADV